MEGLHLLHLLHPPKLSEEGSSFGDHSCTFCTFMHRLCTFCTFCPRLGCLRDEPDAPRV